MKKRGRRGKLNATKRDGRRGWNYPNSRRALATTKFGLGGPAPRVRLINRLSMAHPLSLAARGGSLESYSELDAKQSANRPAKEG